MTRVNLDSVIDVLSKQARREQDLSLIERDNAYLNHVINWIMLSGAMQFVLLLKQKGAVLELDEAVAKELGFDVAS
jgi:ABC-type Fe3+-siderophore transport system permease subunit